MWLYSGKISCIPAKVVLFGQSGCFLKNGFSRTKVVVFRQKWLYSGKVVVIGQNCSFFVQKWL